MRNCGINYGVKPLINMVPPRRIELPTPPLPGCALPLSYGGIIKNNILICVFDQIKYNYFLFSKIVPTKGYSEITLAAFIFSSSISFFKSFIFSDPFLNFSKDDPKVSFNALKKTLTRKLPTSEYLSELNTLFFSSKDTFLV